MNILIKEIIENVGVFVLEIFFLILLVWGLIDAYKSKKKDELKQYNK